MVFNFNIMAQFTILTLFLLKSCNEFENKLLEIFSTFN
jgi:hypothetical protein